MSTEITILVHGFNKNISDMAYLETGLKQAGFDVFAVNLPARFGSLEQCRNALYHQIKDIVHGVDVVNYVAHSMGGLITRSLIASIKQQNVGHCVFIATPHGGSKLAAIANCIPLYATVFKPITNLLPNLKYPTFTSHHNFKIGLIAGSHNQGLIGRLFLSNASDGRVEISAVKTPDMDEFKILHYSHTKIHHSNETLIAVKKFLTTGSFEGS
ncbi:MAG: hypothetical protein HRU23_18720 [Gammaproteobacteria bacterium]|nr:hypothetical protein [Gammaproteobacteria bacterium]